MSKIENLIKQYCPNGVEYKKIDELCIVKTGGDTPKNCIKGQKEASAEHPYPVFSNGTEIYGYADTYRIDRDAVSISSIGNVGYVAYREAYFTPIIRLKVLLPNNDVLKTKYLYYALTAITFIGTNSSLSSMKADDVKKYRIPVPPLPVQEEIVRILDAFTSLEAELEAELEARKKQYEYYRNRLLSFDKEYTGGQQVKFMQLGDVAYYPTDRVSVESLTPDTYVSVENLLKNKQGKCLSTCVPTDGNVIGYVVNDIIIGNIRPYLRKIWLANNNGGTNADVVLVRIMDEYTSMLKPKFLYHILSDERFFEYNNQYAKGAKMPRGDKNMILKYLVPIPPLEEQERIVAILDKFDRLLNDISEGLPAEIEARRKQYEHYRNKLLTFDEVA